MSHFEKTPGWLDFYPNPSKPRLTLPAGAVDAQVAVVLVEPLGGEVGPG